MEDDLKKMKKKRTSTNIEDDLKKMEDDLKKMKKWKTTTSTIKKINLNWLWHNSKLN
jgi:hypothetical protein